MPYSMPNGSQKKELIDQDFRVYYPSACAVCYKTAPDIKRCSRCKAVAYCSNDHQILDWHEHKKICKTISETVVPFPKKTFRGFNEYCVAMRYAWSKQLRRELTPYEEMIALNFRACAYCFTTENLYDCTECFCVSYCSKEHERFDSSRHGYCCRYLKLGLHIDQLVATRDFINVDFTPVDDKEMFMTDDIQKHLTATETEVFFEYLNVADRNKALNVYKTQFVLLGLNIYYAIKKTKFKGNCLVLHFVGAHMAEFLTDWLLVTRMLKHFVGVEKISYYMVGLHISDCHTRYGDQKEFTVKFIEGKYHNVVSDLPKPDFVFAFNCGLHEYAATPETDPWRDSVPALLHYKNVPLVLTSYTKDELVKDFQIIKSVHYFDLSVIDELQENYFASLKPFRNWASYQEPVFYMCGYIMIVEKSKLTSLQF